MAPKRKATTQKPADSPAPSPSTSKPRQPKRSKPAKPPLDEAFRRVTRSRSEQDRRLTRSATKGDKGKGVASGSSASRTPSKKQMKKKGGKGKAKAKAEENNAEGDAENAEQSGKTVIVEYCKQCKSFKTRAVQVKEGLKKAAPEITVLLNPDEPRKGCFEIREDGGEKFVSLLDMKRPFSPMKELDMEKVISELIEKIKG